MHLRKLPSGTWRVIVKHGGLQRTATAPTRTKAQALGAELLLELGKTPTGSTATLGDLLELHLAEQGYAATTLYDLRLVVARLPDDVLEWRVTDVTTYSVEALYRRLRKAGWTPHRVRKLHMLLSSAWNARAVAYHWSTSAVMADVKAPAATIPEVQPPSRDDVRAVLAAVDQGVAVFFRLAAVTGARRGELCGLQWADIDLARREVTVRRSVSTVPGVGAVISEGKSGRKGQRVIGVDPETCDLLAAWRQVPTKHQTAGNMAPDPLWVFSHTGGLTPWRGDYISREFRRACDRTGVGAHLHSLRHFMATTWLAGGEAALEVAGRLGHSTSATTLRVYGHWTGAHDRDTADRYGAQLDG